MNNFLNMVWIELRKARSSRMPLWVGLASLLMPLGIAFLIFLARNPELANKLGLISAKADLLAYSATDWSTYFSFMGQMIAAAGFIFFVMLVSWTFGREFTDGTVTDLLAVPVPRATIVLAKFFAAVLWSLLIAIEIVAVAFVMGLLTHIPGGATSVYMEGLRQSFMVSVITIILVLPFAFFASAGRGYLLPIGLAIVTLIFTNIVALAGWGEYFPWAVAGLYSQNIPLLPISYWLVVLTGLGGIAATYAWWRFADHT